MNTHAEALSSPEPVVFLKGTLLPREGGDAVLKIGPKHAVVLNSDLTHVCQVLSQPQLRSHARTKIRERRIDESWLTVVEDAGLLAVIPPAPAAYSKKLKALKGLRFIPHFETPPGFVDGTRTFVTSDGKGTEWMVPVPRITTRALERNGGDFASNVEALIEAEWERPALLRQQALVGLLALMQEGLVTVELSGKRVASGAQAALRKVVGGWG